jgi:tetratricopeptide (TPR) repeat protein
VAEEINVIGLGEKRAEKFIEQGMNHFSKGELNEAVSAFQKSAELAPTAEAFTYWGWMLSFRGELDEAISLCRKAIECDPEFGNPYNDIGTYYMKKGELESAVPWLEKAKEAKRYEPKHFPYLNLGRIYLSQGTFIKALKEFECALKYDPDNAELRAVIDRIRQNANTYTS